MKRADEIQAENRPISSAMRRARCRWHYPSRGLRQAHHAPIIGWVRALPRLRERLKPFESARALTRAVFLSRAHLRSGNNRPIAQHEQRITGLLRGLMFRPVIERAHQLEHRINGGLVRFALLFRVFHVRPARFPLKAITVPRAQRAAQSDKSQSAARVRHPPGRPIDHPIDHPMRHRVRGTQPPLRRRCHRSAYRSDRA